MCKKAGRRCNHGTLTLSNIQFLSYENYLDRIRVAHGKDAEPMPRDVFEKRRKSSRYKLKLRDQGNVSEEDFTLTSEERATFTQPNFGDRTLKTYTKRHKIHLNDGQLAHYRKLYPFFADNARRGEFWNFLATDAGNSTFTVEQGYSAWVQIADADETPGRRKKVEKSANGGVELVEANRTWTAPQPSESQYARTVDAMKAAGFTKLSEYMDFRLKNIGLSYFPAQMSRARAAERLEFLQERKASLKAA